MVKKDYMYKGKKYKVNIIVDALVINQFLEEYKEFYSGSMKNKKNKCLMFWCSNYYINDYFLFLIFEAIEY